ncbi:S41 family peptidase [Helicobacter fennelliae]|uniref:Carboxyl-terminal protease n=2 Tax=Helicobacter TaxID=209 RepID=T1CR46_9HELI|nr:S41 family peptidase [Helicobacter fennelliae]GAD19229.1 carboxyl-terminal protease [Helicobacter fennelliae MRY12-0050]STP08294.1 secreted protease [Helicobacter fennelliae]STQ84707.1 secreted protease [Helicobacter fennelliae]
MSRNFVFGICVGIVWVFLTMGNLEALSQQNASLQVDSKKQRAQAYERLTKTVATIEAYYVEDMNINEIIDKAIDGLLANLDAHSAYLNDKKYKELKTQTDGEFGGLGITVGMKDGALTVIAPLEDTPAQKAGLKSGDVILKINEQSTIGMSIDDAVNLMRGKPKTTINLMVVRKGEGKPLEFKITRDIIKVRSVYAKTIENLPYLYLRINSFDKNVTDSVKQILKDNPKIEGLVLDLRNNPGGLLEQAVDLSKLFISNGVIVSQKGKVQEENIVYDASGKAPYPDLPIVVLVNAGTASASEIVSGALQDHKRGLIVGEDTFGKGSVQVVIPINNSDAIKLTTAKYYLPSGRTIQAVGIKPDILVYPGAVPQNNGGFELKEADLRNHLQNELQKIDKDSTTKKDEKSDEKETQKTTQNITMADIANDIQLKSGIDVLKAWAILKAPHSTIKKEAK